MTQKELDASFLLHLLAFLIEDSVPQPTNQFCYYMLWCWTLVFQNATHFIYCYSYYTMLYNTYIYIQMYI